LIVAISRGMSDGDFETAKMWGYPSTRKQARKERDYDINVF